MASDCFRAVLLIMAMQFASSSARICAEEPVAEPVYFKQTMQSLGLDGKSALRFSATADLFRLTKDDPAAGLHVAVKYRFTLTYAIDGRYIAETTITNGGTPEVTIAKEIDSFDGAKYFSLNALNQRMLMSSERDFTTIHLALNPVGLLFDAIPQNNFGNPIDSPKAFLVRVKEDLLGWRDLHGHGAQLMYERKRKGSRPETLTYTLDPKSKLPIDAFLTDGGLFPATLAPLPDAYISSDEKPPEKKLNAATVANCQTSYDFELKSISANGKERWIPVKATRKKFEFFKAGDAKDEALINKKVAVAGNGGWQFVTERLETRLADPEWINLDEIEFTLNPAMAGKIVNVDPPAASGSSKDGK